MRIAVLTNAYPPASTGGAGRIAQTYTDALTADGHEVRVWGPDEAFGTLGARGAFSRFAFHLQDLKPRKGLARDLLAWKPDILLTHNLTGCGFGTPSFAASSGVPWFHVLHDVQLFEPSGRIIHGEPPLFHLRRAWRLAWARTRAQAMGVPKGVISPTQWLLDLHRAYGLFENVPAAVIPNPIAAPIFPVSPRDVRAVLFAGRLDTDKGAGTLYSAWPRLREQASKLVLIGDGEWHARFSALRDPRIHVLGKLSGPDVLSHMAAVGIVVVPSLVAENQPTVALEALAAGCQVIASNVGGVKETLAGCGELVKPGNAAALADACLRFVGASPDKERLARVQTMLADHLPALAASRLVSFVRSNL